MHTHSTRMLITGIWADEMRLLDGLPWCATAAKELLYSISGVWKILFEAKLMLLTGGKRSQTCSIWITVVSMQCEMEGEPLN